MTIDPSNNDMGVYEFTLMVTYISGNANCSEELYFMPYKVTIAPSVKAYYEINKTFESENWTMSLPDDVLEVATELSTEVNDANFVEYLNLSSIFLIRDLSDAGISLGEYFIDVTITFENGETSTQ